MEDNKLIMESAELDVVTGAFGYTGKYIARRLLSMGKTVRTLTGHPNRESPFGDRAQAFPFNFDQPEALMESLQGVTTLYNTYWIRFPHGKVTFEKAIENTRTLIRAAEGAGIGTHQHHQCFRGVAASVFQREGCSGKGHYQLQVILCHPPANGDIRD